MSAATEHAPEAVQCPGCERMLPPGVVADVLCQICQNDVESDWCIERPHPEDDQ